MKAKTIFILLIATVSVLMIAGAIVMREKGSSISSVPVNVGTSTSAVPTTNSTDVWNSAQTSEITPTPIVNANVTSNADTQHKTYANKAFHFSIAFPANLTASQYNETSGALSVTFRDDERGEAFQVYVTPYADKQVTSQQFTLDEPSGVKKDAKDVMIDGVRGTMFFSTNTSLGNTREVWFIKNGFLYEVTTYQELDAWLSQIMTTWKFL